MPFQFEEPSSTSLTPEQVKLVVGEVFSSWKFWAALICIAAVSAWAVVKVADHVIDTRAKAYMTTLQETATNNITAAAGQISNQIAMQFRSPKIKATIEQVARERALDVFSKGVQPTLEAFQEAIDLANSQLARQSTRASNSLSQLESDIADAQRRVPLQVISTSAPPVAPKPSAIIANTAPATATDNPVADSGVRLILANRTVTTAGSNYLLTLFFVKATNSAPRGTVELDAATYRLTARVINFAPMTSSPNEAPVINETGDIARLRYTVTERETPNVVMELSAPTIVRILSDSLDTDLTIPVAADKMSLPPPASR